jgi:hypothetical protein
LLAGHHFNYFNDNYHQFSGDHQIAHIRASFCAGFITGFITGICREPSGK